MGIKLFLLILFFAVMVGVGFYSRRHVNSVDGFVLGGRSVGPWLTAFAYGTSYFSAVVFVGYAGQFGWKYGIASTWIGIGNALIGSLLAWVILGRRTKVMTQHLSAKTMPDFFGQRYGSKSLKIVASVIVFVFLIPYTASVYNGLSRLFGMAFNIPYTWCVIAMAVFTAIYVILGGYMATAINDFIQGIIMLFGIVAVIAAVLNGQGGFMEAVSKMAQIPSDVPATMGQPGAFTAFFGPDPLNLLGVVILTSLGTWGLPQMIGKFYAIKDEKSINTGTVISTLFAIVISGGCYFLGGFGRLFDSAEIYNAETGAVVYDSIIPSMLSKLPDILIGIVVVLVLSASMSTLSSLVLTSSSTLTIDLIKPNLKKCSDKKEMLIMRVLIAVFLVISVLLAFNKNASISTLMSYSWGALAGAFLGSFMYGLFSRKITKPAVWTSFILGIGLTLVHMFLFGFGWNPELSKAAASLPLNLASPINAGAITMLLSLIVVPVVSALTKVKDPKHVEQVFTCYAAPEKQA